MSVVGKIAKTGLYLFVFVVLLFVAGGVYLYMNINTFAKQFVEQVATDALGVPVRIAEMDITFEEKKVVVHGIQISNPPGYKKPHAIKVNTVTIAAETLSEELLTFARVDVDGTNVNIEVGQNGTNLGDIKKGIDTKQVNESKTGVSSSVPSVHSDGAALSHDAQPKVIIKKFSLTKAQINPSVTLIDKDLAYIVAPDLHLKGIGQKENGIAANEAVVQIVEQLLQHFNKSANKAGFLKGLSLDALNDIGVSTADVFKKNLKESFDEDVDQIKDGLNDLKSLFE